VSSELNEEQVCADESKRSKYEAQGYKFCVKAKKNAQINIHAYSMQLITKNTKLSRLSKEFVKAIVGMGYDSITCIKWVFVIVILIVIVFAAKYIMISIDTAMSQLVQVVPFSRDTKSHREIKTKLVD
jgi:hypothetical protein